MQWNRRSLLSTKFLPYDKLFVSMSSHPTMLFFASIATLSLFLSVQNIIPLSPLVCMLAPWSLLALGQPTFSRPMLATLVLLVYILVLTLFYSPDALLRYRFYRFDGNIFISYMPIIVLGMLRLPFPMRTILNAFLAASTFVNTVGICVFILQGRLFVIDNEHVGAYSPFFHTHNATGGCLAVTLCFALALYWGPSSKKLTPYAGYVLGLHTFCLLVSRSRGSILALIMAVCVVFILKGRFLKTLMSAIVIGHIALLSYTYPLYKSMNINHDMHVAISEFDGGEMGQYTRMHTISERIYLFWPRALEEFFHSPLFGTGFGSYNDVSYGYDGIDGLISFKIPKVVQYNHGHCHHSFLSILSEAGLIGFIFLCMMLWQWRRSIMTVADKGLCIAFEMAFWVCVWSAMTEHRITTPAQMLPFTILFGLLISSRRSEQNEKALCTVAS